MPPVIALGCLLPLLLAPTPWLERVTPPRDSAELGVYGGAFVLSERNDLYDLRTVPPPPLRRAGPLGGLRAAYFPLAFVGAEAEFDGTWTERADGSEPVFAWGLRGHAVLRLPLARLVPFAFGGYGIMGVRSSRAAVGNDVDPAGHYGLGLQLLATPWLAVRLDGRHVMSAARAQRRAVAHHGAVTLGLTFALGRLHPTPAPEPASTSLLVRDSDRDGIADERDQCPQQPGAGPNGCVVLDTDDDGIVDLHDRCPDQAGPGLDGCPLSDQDDDGIIDLHDRCADRFGTQADGCPRPEPPAPEPLETEGEPAVGPTSP